MLAGAPWTEIPFNNVNTQYYSPTLGYVYFDLGNYFNEPSSRRIVPLPPPAAKPAITPFVRNPIQPSCLLQPTSRLLLSCNECCLPTVTVTVKPARRTHRMHQAGATCFQPMTSQSVTALDNGGGSLASRTAGVVNRYTGVPECSSSKGAVAYAHLSYLWTTDEGSVVFQSSSVEEVLVNSSTERASFTLHMVCKERCHTRGLWRL
jgi:hypothetical protein